MHASRYNVVADGPNGEMLLFNAANGAFAALDATAFDEYVQGSCPNEMLEAFGFFTELTPKQELELQQTGHFAERVSTDELGITIAPTYACNHKCPYCYEAHHETTKGIMTPEILDAIYDFVVTTYEKQQFSRLFVEWYGGDPSLCLDIVRDFSKRLIEFADAHEVLYDAMILTNCNLIDEEAAELLADARINESFVTIDGFEDEHNKRRVSANGSNSYKKTLEAVRFMTERGIHVTGNMNIDKVNIKQLPELRKLMRDEYGVEMLTEQLNDYGHFFGEGAFTSPDFDLYTHEDYAHAIHDEQKASGLLDFRTLRGILQPVPWFCRGQKENYYVIDAQGDVYKCDGWMGDKRYRKFNILDGEETVERNRHEVTFDATRDDKCSQCNILPICQGSCYWERCCNDDFPCHPLKITIGDYLRDWRECFGEIEDASTLLAGPIK